MLKKLMSKGFSAFVVLLCILHIDIFIAAIFYISMQGYSFSDTAITCFFSFWAVEILSLAGIKVSKSKYASQTFEEKVDELIEEADA